MMGILTIDHSGMDKKPGTKYGLNELHTVSCIHCQAPVAIFRRGCTEYAVSGLDILNDVLHAHEFPPQYVHKHRCAKCNDNICKCCAALMEITGVCPGPYKARVERALEQK